MAFRITGDCIECKACLGACEYQAIFHVRSPDAHPCFTIDPSACSHCWPFDQHPRCVEVCPVECIVIDAERPVPSVQALRGELERVLAVAGPYEAARMIARLRQWVREWSAHLLSARPVAVDPDTVLDFYNALSLIEEELRPMDAGVGLVPLEAGREPR